MEATLLLFLSTAGLWPPWVFDTSLNDTHRLLTSSSGLQRWSQNDGSHPSGLGMPVLFPNSTQQQASLFLLIYLLLSYLSNFLEVLPQSFHDSCTFSVLKTEENAFEAWGQRVSSWGTLSQLSHLSAQILKAEACLMTRPWSVSPQFEI